MYKSRLVVWISLFCFVCTPGQGLVEAFGALGSCFVAEAIAGESSWETPEDSAISQGSGYTGQPQFGIPVVISGAGRRAPRVSLNYTSTREGGWAGDGWDLDLPRITQSRADGNRYILTDGSRQEIYWGWTGMYFTRREGIASQVSYWHSSDKRAATWDLFNNCWFEVRKPDGSVHEYATRRHAGDREDNWDVTRVHHISTIRYADGGRAEYYYDSHWLPPQKFLLGNSIVSEIRYFEGKRLVSRVEFLTEPREKVSHYQTHRIRRINVYAGKQSVRSYELAYYAGDLLKVVTLRDSAGSVVRSLKMEWTYREGRQLLAGITTDRGLETRYDYRLAWEYHGYDGHQKFASHVVSSRRVSAPVLEPLVTLYDYEGGREDAEGFVGFERVSVQGPDGSRAVDFYHLDPVFRGKLRRTERFDADGQLVNRLTNDWDSFTRGGIAVIELRGTRVEEFDGSGKSYASTGTRHFYNAEHGYLERTETVRSDSPEVLTKGFTMVDVGGWNWQVQKETLTAATGKDRRVVSSRRYEHDAQGNQTGKHVWKRGDYWVSATTLFQNGYPVEVTDPRGVSRQMEVAAGRLVSVSQGGRLLERYDDYDVNCDKPQAVTDENGQTTRERYDSQCRPVEKVFPDGGRQWWEYREGDAVNPFLVVVTGREGVTGGEKMLPGYQHFDALSRLVQTATPMAGGYSVVRSWYDPVTGRKERVCGPFMTAGGGQVLECPPEAPVVQYHYDSRGRLIQETRKTADGEGARTTYSYRGLLTTVTGPDGDRKTTRRDSLSRVVEVIEHAGESDLRTSYRYDSAGNLTGITDSRGSATSMEYDRLGRRTRIKDPYRGVWKSVHDANGNLTVQQGPGLRVEYQYDERNRPVHKITRRGDGAVEVLWQYDQSENGQGRLSSVSTGGITDRVLRYDTMGRPLATEREFAKYGRALGSSMTYDALGRLLAFRDGAGTETLHDYHEGTMQLRSIRSAGGEVSAVFEQYTPAGQAGQINYGNGTSTRYTHDEVSGRLLGYITSSPANTPESDLQRKSYDYTAGGRISAISNGLTGRRYIHGYDALLRLVSETESGPGGSSRSLYSYDGTGNILARETARGKVLYRYTDPAAPGRLGAVELGGRNYPVEHDALGNMTSGPDLGDENNIGVRRILYRADGLPREISTIRTGAVVSFEYDGNSRRAVKTEGGQTTLYAGNCELRLEGNREVLTSWISAGGNLVASLSGSRAHYYHRDHLGSTAVVTDAAGKKVEAVEYTPFGAFRDGQQPQEIEFGFTGQRHDAQTGLYYYHSRYYDPDLGRFVMADTIIPDPASPQSLNPYSYCHNDPVNYTDPSGHERHRNDDLTYPDLDMASSGLALAVLNGLALAGEMVLLTLLPETSPGTILAISASFSAVTNALAAYGRGSGAMGIAAHAALGAATAYLGASKGMELAGKASVKFLGGFRGYATQAVMAGIACSAGITLGQVMNDFPGGQYLITAYSGFAGGFLLGFGYQAHTRTYVAPAKSLNFDEVNMSMNQDTGVATLSFVVGRHAEAYVGPTVTPVILPGFNGGEPVNISMGVMPIPENGAVIVHAWRPTTFLEDVQSWWNGTSGVTLTRN